MKTPKTKRMQIHDRWTKDEQEQGEDTETQHRMDKRQQQTKLKAHKREKTPITNYIINIKY